MMYVLLASALLASANAQAFPGGVFPGGSQSCYTTPSRGKPAGECLQSNCCEGSAFVSNLCQNYQANVRCCYSTNTCTSSCGSCSDAVAKDYACRILAMHERRQIRLKGEHFDPRGNNPYDGASALSNIRDTCYGRQVKRSKYCSQAPGGCVCLKGAMLKGLHTYATKFFQSHGQPVAVNSLAGSCHSSLKSKHYQGNTFDVACKTPRDHCSQLRDWCKSQNIVQACYPGSTCGGHATWVHCAFAY